MGVRRPNPLNPPNPPWDGFGLRLHLSPLHTESISFGSRLKEITKKSHFQTKSVYIRICHHVGKQFHKDVVIGYIDVPLKEITDLSTKKEVLLVENLKPKLSSKVGIFYCLPEIILLQWFRKTTTD